MKMNKTALLVALAIGSSAQGYAQAAETLTEALTTGKVSTDLRLRYETVDQDNAAKDADALTLRTRLTYTTGDFKGFSAGVEFEDSRVALGVDDYKDTNGKGAAYSVIADPEVTELDQAFVQYKNDMVAVKVGRQVVTMDNHRFVGHVGWRQDRQTFDGVTVAYQPVKGLKLTYAYLDKRNRIFGEEKDIDSKDHLLNASYKTDLGKLTAYAYLLEVDNGTDNALDTYGLRFSGATKLDSTKISYTIEYATQDIDSATTSYSADYLSLEAGATFSGITAKLGMEMLGSDDGMKAFSTPLATLHKFNGWSDQFLGTPNEGLVDIYASVGGKLAGGKWAVIYHDFSADEDSATVDDLGTEINAVYTKPFSKNYVAGIKFASYSAGDIKADTDKVWVWGQVKF